MDRIAYIVGETFIYWSSIVLALAAVTAVCVFLWLYLGKSGNGLAAALMVPMALTSSLVLSRLVHWYCRTDAYESFAVALGDFSQGGYALLGVFMGCILVALLLRLFGIVENLPELLDALALAGGAGIAVGRLAPLFNASDRGMHMSPEYGLPLVYPVANAVTGEPEYRLATFMLQAILVGVIILALIVFYLIGKRKTGKLRDGDTCLMFLAAYCTTQAVLDSTRYDSLFFRSNGFVGMVQVLSAVMLVAAIVIFSVRLVRARKWHWGFLGFWVSIGGLLGLAGYMEYYVQRHGDRALFAYSVMSSCLLCVLILCYVIRFLAVRAELGMVKVKRGEEASESVQTEGEKKPCAVRMLISGLLEKLSRKGTEEEEPPLWANMIPAAQEEVKPAEETQAVEETPVDEAKPVEEEKPIEEAAPVEEEKPVEEAAPVEEEKFVEEGKPAEEVKAAETAELSEADTPAEPEEFPAHRFRPDRIPLSIRIPPIRKSEKKQGKFFKNGQTEEKEEPEVTAPAPEPEEEYIDTADILSELDRVLGEDAKVTKKRKKKN